MACNSSPVRILFGASALVLSVMGTSQSDAAEYGFTTYPLGSSSFGAGVTPPPGTYITNTISYASLSIGGNLDFGNVTLGAGAKADIFSEGISVLIVPETQVLDGRLGFLVSVPVAAHVGLEASVTGPLGNTFTDETDGWGVGDTILQLQLGWDKGDFSHTFHVLGVLPTGRYDTGFYPIIGLNRPSLDVGWAFTYFDKGTKLQFNGSIGFMTSLMNQDTQYQTGDEFHAEWAIGYKFDNGLIIGVNGYDYRQITGDSGSGAIFAPFKSVQDAIGPGISYSTMLGETPVTLSVRDYAAYNWENMFHGNVVIGSMTAVFPAAQPMEKAWLKN